MIRTLKTITAPLINRRFNSSEERMFAESEEQDFASTCRALPEIENIRNSCCAVIIQSLSDYNGALSDTYTMIPKINKLGITCIFKKVSDLKEMKQIMTLLRSNNNEIKALFLNAHGHPFRIQFGTIDKPRFITTFHRDLHESLHLVSPQGIVILNSCSTGKERFLPCIGRALSFAHPDQTFIAPNRNITQNDCFTDHLLSSQNRTIRISPNAKPPWAFFQRGYRIEALTGA